jgi:protein TonB
MTALWLGSMPRIGLGRAWAAGLLALLAACSTPPPAKKEVALPPPPPPVLAVPAPPVAEPPAALAPAPAPVPARVASAVTPREYRRYGASHIYEHNSHRIYSGKMPPMLYAVGVLNVDIDGMGRVQRLDWMRAPKHAPEVMTEIERLVRAAAPYPAPVRMGRVTWTDTWLWDRSGRFQLDTLTEGQLGRLAVEPKPRKK